jgi:glycosyltransferase involved in cell wall biosynthesis
VTHRENGWLYDVNDGAQFSTAVTEALANPTMTQALAAAGAKLARADYDQRVLASRVKELYATIAEEKQHR